MTLRCATFNVLADAYTSYGDYSHVDPAIMAEGARTPDIVRLIDGLDVDVVGLQEAEAPLVEALDETNRWQSFWSQKELDKPDGCLMLVRNGIETSDFDTRSYSDGSGHIVQKLRIGRIVIANTHIKWAPEDEPEHAGVAQTAELLEYLKSDRAAVILADCNDRPNGPVRRLVEAAGFVDFSGDVPTALVNQQPVALDLLAVRGVSATYISTEYSPTDIPSRDCPSDHIPVLANLEIV